MMKQSHTMGHINGKEFSEVINDMEEKTIDNKKIIKKIKQETLKMHEELLFLETPKSICELINISSDQGRCSLM